MSEQKKQREQKKQYTFEEDTAIVAQTIINIVDTSIVDPHAFIIALLEGYAERIRTMYTHTTARKEDPGPQH